MRFDGDGTALRVAGASVGRKQPAEEGQEAEQEEQGVVPRKFSRAFMQRLIESGGLIGYIKENY